MLWLLLAGTTLAGAALGWAGVPALVCAALGFLLGAVTALVWVDEE